MLIIISLTLLLVNFSHQITLNCTFTTHSTYIGTEYCCIAKNLLTSYDNRVITDVVGTHEGGKTNADVKKIFIKFQNCPYLPLNIGEFFPNLEIFYIMMSNLQHLLPGDLNGLNKLKKLDVSHNPIQEITADFFKGHEIINTVSFFDCHLRRIEKGTFDGMKDLRIASFHYNFCVHSVFEPYEKEITDKRRAYFADLYDKCTGSGVVLRQHKPVVCDNTHLTASTKFGIFLMILIIIITAVLGVALIKIYTKNFQKNWNEMTFPIVDNDN